MCPWASMLSASASMCALPCGVWRTLRGDFLSLFRGMNLVCGSCVRDDMKELLELTSRLYCPLAHPKDMPSPAPPNPPALGLKIRDNPPWGWRGFWEGE